MKPPQHPCHPCWRRRAAERRDGDAGVGGGVVEQLLAAPGVATEEGEAVARGAQRGRVVVGGRDGRVSVADLHDSAWEQAGELAATSNARKRVGQSLFFSKRYDTMENSFFSAEKCFISTLALAPSSISIITKNFRKTRYSDMSDSLLKWNFT